MFEGFLRDQGLEARGEQIIDETLVPVPKQSNRRISSDIKADRLPNGWDENTDRLQKRDLDVHWIKKNGVSQYGYKNSNSIDAENGFIKRYSVTLDNIYNSQMHPMLLDPENQDDFVLADSAYSGECIEYLLMLGGFESCSHEKCTRNHPLSEAAKERKPSGRRLELALKMYLAA